MRGEVVNIQGKFEKLTETWTPKVVEAVNDYHLKIARVDGAFIWHDHPETDEAFFVIEGRLTIEMDRETVVVGPGEIYVVPKGVRHRPIADGEVKLMLIEPGDTHNTGREGGGRTKPTGEWI